MLPSFSQEHIEYLKKEKKQRKIILFWQIFIIIFFFMIWQILSKLNIINTFLYSSPFNIIKTILNLLKEHSLFNHLFVTIYEIVLSFLISIFLGMVISTLFWWNNTLSKIFDPYLTIINSLPKVSLGPLIIIWIGANINSIIFMSLMISLFITIINLYTAFKNTNKNYIILMKSMHAIKRDIYFKVVIPSNKDNIINTLKINMSMNFIGVIMGELLVSKEGLGYLITYGSQIFNINLVITSIVILEILSTIFYYILNYIYKKNN